MAELLNAQPGNYTRPPNPPAIVDEPFNATVKTIRILDGYGLRNVAYYVTPDNNAVVEGDIVYGTLSELLAAAAAANNDTQISKRAHSIFATTGTERPWPGARLPYKYVDDAAKTALDAIVTAATRRWTSVISGLQFVEDPSATGAFIEISNTVDGGCNCNIGWVNNRKSSMNLEPGCNTDNAAHEFGHALGLWHEHQRKDRDSFLHIFPENINGGLDKDGKPCPVRTSGFVITKDSCCSRECNFVKKDDQDSSGAYDFSSLMHYFENAFGRVDASGTTLTTLSPIDSKNSIRRGPNPSPLDYRRICDLYSLSCVICGDGIRQGSEECDDGNLDPGDGCDRECRSEVCGNFRVDFGEECDDGPSGSKFCDANCKLRCGNGIVDSPDEECDDGPFGSDTCDSFCKFKCGNGIVDSPIEECDDGNKRNGDGCSSTCKREPLCVQCNPNPPLNKCDVTTSCFVTPDQGAMCVCRPGFKADADNDQKAIHWRLKLPA
ncbi:8131_t:CDS:2, partial [Paraglomus brasilianum]